MVKLSRRNFLQSLPSGVGAAWLSLRRLTTGESETDDDVIVQPALGLLPDTGDWTMASSYVAIERGPGDLVMSGSSGHITATWWPAAKDDDEL